MGHTGFIDTDQAHGLLDTALAAVGALDEFCRIADDDLLMVAQKLEVLARRIYGVQVNLTDEIDTRSVAADRSCTSTGALLREILNITIHEANGRVRAAKALIPQDLPSGDQAPTVLPKLAAAVAEGAVDADHVRVILGFERKIPGQLPPAEREWAEEFLVDEARTNDAGNLSSIADYLENALNPDGTLHDKTPHERAELIIGRRNKSTGLTLIKGRLDDIGIETLRKAIDMFTKPRPSCQQTYGTLSDITSGDVVIDPTSPAPMVNYSSTAGADVTSTSEVEPGIMGTAANAAPDNDVAKAASRGEHLDTQDADSDALTEPHLDARQAVEDILASQSPLGGNGDTLAVDYEGECSPGSDATAGGRENFGGNGAETAGSGCVEDIDGLTDTRPASTRLAHALTEALQVLLNSGGLPAQGGERPHITVVVNWDLSSASIGAARLPSGVYLTPEETRRLLCDAQITPAILGTQSEVLDLGRTRRTFSPAQRRALVLRDGGCAWPGCSRPPEWADAHHILWWERDLGETCLNNGVLLCKKHHTEIHKDNWRIVMNADGRPDFIPPRWIDPEQHSRRNTLHHNLDRLNTRHGVPPETDPTVQSSHRANR